MPGTDSKMQMQFLTHLQFLQKIIYLPNQVYKILRKITISSNADYTNNYNRLTHCTPSQWNEDTQKHVTMNTIYLLIALFLNGMRLLKNM